MSNDWALGCWENSAGLSLDEYHRAIGYGYGGYLICWEEAEL